MPQTNLVVGVVATICKLTKYARKWELFLASYDKIINCVQIGVLAAYNGR